MKDTTMELTKDQLYAIRDIHHRYWCRIRKQKANRKQGYIQAPSTRRKRSSQPNVTDDLGKLLKIVLENQEIPEL